MSEKGTARRWVIGVTGASGLQYTITLFKYLKLAGIETHTIFSESALRVLNDELGIAANHSNLEKKLADQKIFIGDRVYNPKDIGAEPASGTCIFEGMVICPCSMGTLGSIANGISANLIHRSADVMLKESRKLVLVPRETPLSLIHLKNMTTVLEAGAKLLPAMPGFYLQPKSVQDLVDSLVQKILDQMGVNYKCSARWKEQENEVNKLKVANAEDLSV